MSHAKIPLQNFKLKFLFQTCSIIICPAGEDCVATSYADQRAIDDDACGAPSPGSKQGFKANYV